jgi:hypothetical protein
MNKEIKELTITYTVKLATYEPKELVTARDNLYILLGEVFYNSAVGLSFLVKTTELRIEGEE